MTLSLPEITVRRAIASDAASLLALMHGLAEFEGYADRFAVSELTLHEQGFRREPGDFVALVAETPGDDPQRVGMLVYYFIRFTFQARPMLFIKELFVAEPGRGRGVGERLMRAAARDAVAAGCAGMKWQVATWNDGAKRFYERLGAAANPEWVEYGMSERAVESLATGSS